MGEIVRAPSPLRRVLLVGQAPGADGDTRPLTGTMGRRLAELAGLGGVAVRTGTPADEVIGLFTDRANVLDFYPGRSGKGHAFPIGLARDAAARMFDELDSYDRVLFCGKAVYDGFRRVSAGRDTEPWPRDLPMLTWLRDTWTTELAWMPHTSMIVPWWNDPVNVERASVFLSELFAFARGREYLRGVA